MILIEAAPKDVFLVDPEPVQAERVISMRTWHQQEFEALGFQVTWIQSSVSLIHQKDLWGHCQSVPHEEVKLGRCTAGVIYDVIVDVRPTSPTYRQHFGITLSADNRRTSDIPKCCAYGLPMLEQKRKCRTACWNSMCLQALEDFDGMILRSRLSGQPPS